MPAVSPPLPPEVVSRGVESRPVTGREAVAGERSDSFRPSLEVAAVAAVIGACLLALVYPLITLAGWMLGRGHYQHFPLLLMAAVGLAAYRLRADPPRWLALVTPRVLAWTFFAVALTLLVFVLPSRWLASVAALVCLVAASRLFGIRDVSWSWSGPLLLLAAALPLPVNLDAWFVVGLQQLATWFASVWLDYRGVMHLTTGVAIQTPGHEYFVKDACSGINSVFAAVAVGVGYGVIRDYSVRRVAVLVLQMLAWVVVTNAGRVFITVYAQSRWGIDASGVTAHEVIGLVTFGTGILLALSTDHLIRYLRPTEKVRLGVGLKKLNGTGNTKPSWLDRALAGRWVVSLVVGLAVSALALGGSFFRFEAQPIKPIPIEEMARAMVLDLDRMSEASMPERLGDWRRIGFRTEKRGPESVFGGMISLVWQYHDGRRAVAMSLDGPYDAWHDLAVCYGGVGWQVSDMRTHDTLGDRGDWQACELSLERHPVETAQVVYICVRPDGQVVPPPPYFGMPFASLVRRLRVGVQDGPKSMPGVVQLQLMDHRSGELSTTDLKANRELFSLAVQHLFAANP